ncbi:MAG: diguanylate cyclase/phosphodiesterase with sensor(s) [Proteobacteria bacterium]|nr:diguanylate cyclase/phosphodiesterase with sensor(s) [Pseudomonadota bacterium]
MKRATRQLRQAVLAALLLFIGSMLAVTGYTLWRLRADAIVSGLEIAAMQAQGFEDVLTQSLHVSELVAANVLPLAMRGADRREIETTFVTTLRRAPFLRSMSLLDDRQHIVASSNPANVGLTMATQSYLPPASGAQETLRIGQPWSGRDLADGWASTLQTPIASDAQSFIPLTLTLTVDGQSVTLLVTLNPDYFISRITQKLDAAEGSVEILRYDGTLLMSTDPNAQPGTVREVQRLHLAEVESGEFADDSGTLTAFRASHLYPLVLLTHVDLDYALRHWRTEAKALLSVVLTVLLAICLLSIAFYRRQLQLSEQRAESLRLQRINATVFESSTVAILVADDQAKIVSINAEFSRVTGHRTEDLVGHPLFELLDAEGAATFAEKAGDAAPFELQLRCRDGTLIWTEINSTPARDARGAITGYHRICRNVTERKRIEEQVHRLAFHDSLTQLPNRRLLNDRLTQTLAACRRNGSHGALLFLDLDNFKSLNDTHGHGMGDLLLIEVAHRLGACVREMDTVARFGGDEFVVMLSALHQGLAESIAQAGLIAEKIRLALAEPYRLTAAPDAADGAASVEHQCSASIGVALFNGHEASHEDILRWADAAMYRAKEAGPNLIRFHDPAAE